MRKLLIAVTAILLIAMAGSTMAEVVWTGDARIRPRMDIRDRGDYGNTTTDGYYYYRARLNVKGNIGDGWFGHVQLGTNGFAYWTGKFGDPSASGNSKPSSSSVDGASRGPVDFMLIYFGRKTTEFGYWGGLIPLNGLSNPLLDVHYYSNVMVDVPYFLYSNNGAHGFAGFVAVGDHKLNATLIVDDNEGIKTEDPDGNLISKTHDQYSMMFDALLKAGKATIQPVVIVTAADAGMDAPMTFGANLTSPKVGQFTFYATAAMSMQRAGGDAAEYDAMYFRGKAVGSVGPGKLTAWVDVANKKFDAVDIERKYLYWWLDFAIPVYSSDQGSVSIKPTWRHIKREQDGSLDETREKIELTIDFKFK